MSTPRSVASLSPRTPVLIGVGESSDPLMSPHYRGSSPVELAAEAAEAALRDTGADRHAVLAALTTIAAVRQFEVSTPAATSLLGRSDNFPRSVARRLGADPRRAVLEVAGGQSPQRLVSEFTAAVAAGDEDTVLLVGAEAISTQRHLAGETDPPDFTEHVGGQLEDRGFGVDGLTSPAEAEHGLLGAPVRYALLETSRRARLGLSTEDYRLEMGRLLAPFSKVAAAHPHAAAPTARTAEDLASITPSNRMIADPYPRAMVARDQVNQGAALILTTIARARTLGISEDSWVFLHGHADADDVPILERSDLSTSPAAAGAVRRALEMADVSLDDVSTIDLYSCFPIAVLAVTDACGLSATDPRGLTVTGGLPFFGGPGNNYSMHAIAETVRRLRSAPGTYGLVLANGGFLSKFAVGLYSTAPCPWSRPDPTGPVTSPPASPPELTRRADGPAVVETYTVDVRPDHEVGLVIGRLQAGGARFLACTGIDDRRTIDHLRAPGPVAKQIHVTSSNAGNRVSVSAFHTSPADHG